MIPIIPITPMAPIIPTIAHKVSVNWTWMPPFGYPDAMSGSLSPSSEPDPGGPGPLADGSIRVEVKLFATFRQGRFKKEMLDLPGGFTVDDLLKRLVIDPAEVSILLVNAQESQAGRTLATGDAVSLFPGVGGG